MAKVQYNSVTKKVSYNDDTNKVQLFQQSACTSGCTGDVTFPDNFQCVLNGLTFPSGCCDMGASGADNWIWSFGNDTFEMPRTGACIWGPLIGNVTYDRYNSESCNPFSFINSKDQDIFLQLIIAGGTINVRIVIAGQAKHLFFNTINFQLLEGDCDTTIQDLLDGGSIVFTNQVTFGSCVVGGTITLSVP